MPTKQNVKSWFSSVKDNLENKPLDIEDKLKEASANFADSITDPETEKEQKRSNFFRQIEAKLNAINQKGEDFDVRTKVISNDKIRSLAVGICEKLIDKADPSKDNSFKLSVGIVSTLTNSLELLEAEYGETISDDKILTLAEKMMKNPDLQNEGSELLSQWQKDNEQELDMNEELMRAHEEHETKKEENQDGAEVTSSSGEQKDKEQDDQCFSLQ